MGGGDGEHVWSRWDLKALLRGWAETREGNLSPGTGKEDAEGKGRELRPQLLMPRLWMLAGSLESKFPGDEHALGIRKGLTMWDHSVIWDH